MEDAGFSERFQIPRQTISYHSSGQSQGSVLRFAFRKIMIKKMAIPLMIVDPCITVQFIKKNPTRCNNVSDFYYSIFI